MFVECAAGLGGRVHAGCSVDANDEPGGHDGYSGIVMSDREGMMHTGWMVKR